MRISDWSSDVCSSDLFAVFGKWETGLMMIGVNSTVTFFVAQAFFLWTMPAHAMEHLPLIAANFKKSRYAFLPKQGRNGSDARLVGKECVSKCRSRWPTYI